MKFYFAPMEGVTDHTFRNIHHKYFPGLDRYFTPFLSPTQDGRFTGKKVKDVRPEENRGVNVVPQLLTKRSEDFLWAARALADLGYREVNLNLGCPSGTVVAKGKGSGMLANPEGLERFFDKIFAKTPVAVSVKTRLGMREEGEFPRLLEIFNRYPIAELTVHVRVREDFYRLPARLDTFTLPLAQSKAPVCYNGDLTTAANFSAFQSRFPDTPAAMLGRGLVADPALVRRIQGGPSADRETLKQYHDELYESYCFAFQSERNALCRMKEIWFYHICLFEGAEKIEKKLRKTTDPGEYRALAARIFGELPLRAEGALPKW